MRRELLGFVRAGGSIPRGRSERWRDALVELYWGGGCSWLGMSTRGATRSTLSRSRGFIPPRHCSHSQCALRRLSWARCACAWCQPSSRHAGGALLATRQRPIRDCAGRSGPKSPGAENPHPHHASTRRRSRPHRSTDSTAPCLGRAGRRVARTLGVHGSSEASSSHGLQ